MGAGLIITSLPYGGLIMKQAPAKYFGPVTSSAARTLHREHEIGSIVEGNLADFVELSMDPYRAEPARFCDQVTVGSTWRGGRRIDLDAFLAEVKAIDPAAHAHLAKPAQQCP